MHRGRNTNDGCTTPTSHARTSAIFKDEDDYVTYEGTTEDMSKARGDIRLAHADMGFE